MAASSESGQYKAVIFDYGGVLTDGDLTQVFTDAEQRYGIAPGTILQCGLAGGNESLVHRLDRGQTTVSEAFPVINTMIKDKTGIDVDLAEYMTAIDNYLAPSILMTSVVRRLRSAGLKLAVVSNSWKKSPATDDTFLRIDTSLFDTVVVSSEVGMRKPDEDIFQLTLQRLDVKASEAVFLEDVSYNLQAARVMGMTGIKVNASDKTGSVTELGALLAIDLTQ